MQSVLGKRTKTVSPFPSYTKKPNLRQLYSTTDSYFRRRRLLFVGGLLDECWEDWGGWGYAWEGSSDQAVDIYRDQRTSGVGHQRARTSGPYQNGEFLKMTSRSISKHLTPVCRVWHQVRVTSSARSSPNLNAVQVILDLTQLASMPHVDISAKRSPSSTDMFRLVS